MLLRKFRQDFTKAFRQGLLECCQMECLQGVFTQRLTVLTTVSAPVEIVKCELKHSRARGKKGPPKAGFGEEHTSHSLHF
jgi:hypothetical protein